MDFKLFFKCLLPHRESGLASGWAIGHVGDCCKCERCGYIRHGKKYHHRFGGNYECERCRDCGKKLGDWAHSWMDQAWKGGDCDRCSKCGKLVLKARTIGLGANAASAGRYGQSITIGPMTVLQLKALDVGNGVKFVPTAGNADGSKLQNSPLPERGNCSTKSRLRSSRELAGGNCAASAGRARTGEIPDERVTCTC